MVNIWVVIVLYIVVAAVFLAALYFVIRGAVLSALRTHTVNSVTAVTIVDDKKPQA